MAKVGNIMARHNGANVAVADIYDQKVIVENTPVEFADSDTYVLFRADDDGVFDEECGNSFEIKNSQYSTVEIHEYQNADNYFIHVTNTSRVWVTVAEIQTLFDRMIDEGIGYTVDGIFYYPQNTFNRYQRLIEFGYYPINIKSYGNSANLQVAATFLTSGVTTTVAVDNSVFAQPFHFALVHEPGIMKVYFNGVLQCSKSATIHKKNDLLTVGNATTTGSASDISCAFLRLTAGQRWSDNFTPNFNSVLRGFSKPFSVAVRHNNQTYYAPLITTANQPCIAVRHNNATYYTVRS